MAVFLAGAFLAAVLVAVFFAGAFLAVVADFVAASSLAAAFLAGAFLAVDFGAVFGRGLRGRPPSSPDAFFAVAPLVAALAPVAAAASVSFGSFLAPETTALRSAPALNFGMAVFLALIRSPVRGLRTQRASRTRFSKEPKPGDGDLLALRDLAGDRVDHRLQRVRGLLAVALVAGSESVDQLTLVHKLPFREPSGVEPLPDYSLGTLGKSRARHNRPHAVFPCIIWENR